jgi:hypothetical protein
MFEERFIYPELVWANPPFLCEVLSRIFDEEII